MLGSIGFPEMIMIAIMALLVFGPKKLPDIAKTLGKTLREFRKTVNDAKLTIQDEIDKADVTEDLKAINKDIKDITSLDMDVEDDKKK